MGAEPRTSRTYGQAEALRRAFDESFSRDPRTGAPPGEDLLAIRVRSAPFAIRLAELSGVFANKKITWLPGPVASLLGVAGFRGAVLPVYDLGLLLGYSQSGSPSWFAISADGTVGLAFDGFDGHVRATPDALITEQTDRQQPHVREIFRADFVRPIVHIASILASIKRSMPRGPLDHKER